MPCFLASTLPFPYALDATAAFCFGTTTSAFSEADSSMLCPFCLPFSACSWIPASILLLHWSASLLVFASSTLYLRSRPISYFVRHMQAESVCNLSLGILSPVLQSHTARSIGSEAAMSISIYDRQHLRRMRSCVWSNFWLAFLTRSTLSSGLSFRKSIDPMPESDLT